MKTSFNRKRISLKKGKNNVCTTILSSHIITAMCDKNINQNSSTVQAIDYGKKKKRKREKENKKEERMTYSIFPVQEWTLKCVRGTVNLRFQSSLVIWQRRISSSYITNILQTIIIL